MSLRDKGMSKKPAGKVLRPSAAARVSLALVLVLLSVHAFATFGRVAPNNPMSAAYYEPVSGHMEPMFAQAWSIFAPNPQYVDLRLWVRASYDDGNGGEEVTEWFDFSGAFYTQVRHRLVPPRHWRIVSTLYRNHYNAWDALNADQKSLVIDDYRHDGFDELQTDLMDAGGTLSTVEHYLRYEQMFLEFATNVQLTLEPDREPDWIQVRTSSQEVVPYSQRHNDEAEPDDPFFREKGWRPPIYGSERSREVFTTQFERYLE